MPNCFETLSRQCTWRTRNESGIPSIRYGNLAENALRGVAIGGKNRMFAGADCGGERAAAMYSLFETAKLNGVNPQDWLTNMLNRIGKGHPINRLDELLPWNWADLPQDQGSCIPRSADRQ